MRLNSNQQLSENMVSFNILIIGGQLSITSPPTIQGRRINAYSGYHKQKVAEQKARQRNNSKGFYPQTRF